MGRTVNTAIVSGNVPALGDATPLLTRVSDSNRASILHEYLMDQAAVHARIEPSRRDRVVNTFEEAESFDFVERGNYAHAEMTLKNPDYLLQCPLTTIQIPNGWVRSTASIATPVSVFESGGAPSAFALNFVNDWDLRNVNDWDLRNRNYV